MLRFVFAVVVAAIAVGTATAAPPDPFAGAWLATDLDGSNVRLQISIDANGVRRVVLTDDRTGPFCGGGPAQVIGTGTVSGSTLTMSGTLRCPNFTGPATLIIVSSSGTLILDAVIVFAREGNA